MSMSCSQNIENLKDSGPDIYYDTIEVTGVPRKHFVAITSIKPPVNGDHTRYIRIEVMPLEQSDNSTQFVATGHYRRVVGEKQVTVTVYQDGHEMCSNTTAY